MSKEPLELSPADEFAGAAPKSPTRDMMVHHNNNNSTSSTSSSTADASRRHPPQLVHHQQALEEARRVLLASTALDNFNLLGVVANPRANTSNSHRHHHHFHYPRPNAAAGASSNSMNALSNHASGGNSTSTTATAGAHTATTGEHGSGLEDTMLALESTLSQVTEQIDAINSVVDQWSRTYLGHFLSEDSEQYILEYHGDEYGRPPVSQLTELPPELANLTLSTVQDYLNTTGTLAHAFDERQTRFQQQYERNGGSIQDNTITSASASSESMEWHERISPDSELHSGVLEQNSNEFMMQLEDAIPDAFFETYFDLTDSTTFSELLVLEDTLQNTAGSTVTGTMTNGSSQQQQQQKSPPAPPFVIDDGSNSLDSLPEALRIPTNQILKLPPNDAFTGFLDKVELALLQQVRSKSIAFFHETNRFGQLKEWITGLVEEVSRVRLLLASVQDTSVVAWELIPLLDKQRQDLSLLEQVLEGANSVLRCKTSIGGLLSAHDDLGAAEQIQHGRTLLNEPYLRNLLAFKTVHDQFSQYETLVVANLGEELVEILLDWKSKTQDVSRVHDMVRGLQLCHSLESVAQLYASRLLDVIRMTVRTTVGEFADEQADGSVKACVTGMTLERFADCLDMLFEQLLDICRSATGVQEFGREFGVDHFSADALSAAAELSSKSISELLRLRKEAHSLVTLDEMRRLWDVCMAFTLELEKLTDYKATALRSTLLAQAKAFVERQHESNMSSLVAALDSERWMQCDVSSERQTTLTRLCSGRAVMSMRRQDATTSQTKAPLAEVEGIRYKVVWSCLLLVEMVMNNIACAAHFQSLATNVVAKVAELLRLFNSRSTQLVLGAGAIHSAARLKSINAKHLSLVTQCLGMIIAIFPHVRAALMAQLPSKQHGLLQDLDKIKKEYEDHNEKVLNKFVTIIGGIVEHSLAPRIPGTNFDGRVGQQGMCVFLDGVSTNTRKMHQVLSSLLPPDHLQDVFSRIFAFIDQKTPDIFVAATSNQAANRGTFSFPTSDAGKRQMLIEIESLTENLNNLPGVRPWEFTAIRVLERHLEFKLHPEEQQQQRQQQQQNGHHEETNGDGSVPVETSVETNKGEDDQEDSPATVDAAPTLEENPTDAAPLLDPAIEGQGEVNNNNEVANPVLVEEEQAKIDEETTPTTKPIANGDDAS